MIVIIAIFQMIVMKKLGHIGKKNSEHVFDVEV